MCTLSYIYNHKNIFTKDYSLGQYNVSIIFRFSKYSLSCWKSSILHFLAFKSFL